YPGQENWQNVLAIVNKSDLPQKINLQDLFMDAVAISAKTGEGMDTLAAKIQDLFITQNMEYSQEVVTNARHINQLQKARASLQNAINAVDGGMFVDFAAIDIQDAYSALAEITGAVADEELIEKIFSEFCLGK
ncbi:MAG: tRNA uridine-5-carboxymethylaminomethyl(34) synthesis GTPase MnmE, partial [Defluviitaleaceae bacterium]|nr:tRNA uridine-5-carboxymethylaminomethyl(34) synthesis GTPase MnmE [Defluviitaleaceae bacterium]